MLIRVRYRDGKQDLVPPQQLELLIRRKQISMFKRYYGWTDISCSAVRERMILRARYKGPERRKHLKTPPATSLIAVAEQLNCPSSLT